MFDYIMIGTVSNNPKRGSLGWLAQVDITKFLKGRFTSKRVVLKFYPGCNLGWPPPSLGARLRLYVRVDHVRKNDYTGTVQHWRHVIEPVL